MYLRRARVALACAHFCLRRRVVSINSAKCELKLSSVQKSYISEVASIRPRRRRRRSRRRAAFMLSSGSGSSLKLRPAPAPEQMLVLTDARVRSTNTNTSRSSCSLSLALSLFLLALAQLACCMPGELRQMLRHKQKACKLRYARGGLPGSSSSAAAATLATQTKSAS